MGSSQNTSSNKDILFLFDVDGTLSPCREPAPDKIKKMLPELRKRVNIAFLGGSDICKHKEQLGEDILDVFNYGFSENGVQYYKDGKLVESGSIIEHLGEENYKKMINYTLRLLSETDCPIKRGTFIELRTSMINVSPVGRSCNMEERKIFIDYDKKAKVREHMRDIMNKEFEQYGIRCVIGGLLSLDVFPVGWDKTYSLQYIKEKTIVFFGDMTEVGGNDYEIFNHERVKGIKVTGPDDIFEKVNEQLKELGLPKIE